MTIHMRDIANIRSGINTAMQKSIDNKAEESIEYEVMQHKDKNEKKIFHSKTKIDKKYFTQDGDIVIKSIMPYVAKYVTKEDEGLLVPWYFYIIRVNKDSEISGEDLAKYINTDHAQEALNKNAKGTAIPKVCIKDLENMEIVI